MLDSDTVALSETGLSIEELEDTELLALARRNNSEAFAALFTRHTYAAHRLARHLGHSQEAEDIVAESFAQVLDLVRRGKGPDRAFRAYLFTTIRHEAERRARARQRVMPTDDERRIDSAVPFGGGHLDEFEKSAVRGAYESLPDRWRTVLWHLDVEGRKPQELGPLLDLSPNSVSALVYRARSALREAYLQQHVKTAAPAASRTCGDIRSKLSAFVRDKAPTRDVTRVRKHLETCAECTAIHLDLREVNREVGVITVPAAATVSVVGLATGAGWTVGWTSFLAHVTAFGKGLVGVLAAPAAVVAITTASVVGFTASDVVDPPRHASPQQVAEPGLNRVAVAPAPTNPTTKSPASHPGSGSGRTTVRAAAAAPAPAAPRATTGPVGTQTVDKPKPKSPVVAVRVPVPVVPVTVEVGAEGLRVGVSHTSIEVASRTLTPLLSLGTTN